MFSPDLLARAETLLAAARAKGRKIATAESCTGGLIAGLLTEIAGSSDVFERGFVTYSNDAKQELLEVPPELIERNGAVSMPVALAMVRGALKHSRANVAVAVTGIAGPGGGTAFKPVGLVYIAMCTRDTVDTPLECLGEQVSECRFGNIGRDAIRLKTVDAALLSLEISISSYISP